MALDMDFIGFSFNGRHSSEFNVYLVSSGSRYQDVLVPSPTDYTEQVPGRAGELYFGSDIESRQFSISIAYDDLSERQVRQLRQWLTPKATGELIFDERPYKAYSAKISGSPTLDFICFDKADGSRVYKGEGSIEFVCYYPYARVSGARKELKSYSDLGTYGTGTLIKNWKDSIPNRFKEGTKIEIAKILGYGGGNEYDKEYYSKINNGPVTFSKLVTYDSSNNIGKEFELPLNETKIELNSIGSTQDEYNPIEGYYTKRIQEQTLYLQYKRPVYNETFREYCAYIDKECETLYPITGGLLTTNLNFQEMMSDTAFHWRRTSVTDEIPSASVPYFLVKNYAGEGMRLYFLFPKDSIKDTSKILMVKLYTIIDNPQTVKVDKMELVFTNDNYNIIKTYDSNNKEIQVDKWYTVYQAININTAQWPSSTDLLYSLGLNTETGYDHIVAVDNTGTLGIKCYNPGDIDTDFIFSFNKMKPEFGTKLTLSGSNGKYLTWEIRGDDSDSVSDLEKSIYNAESGRIIINTKDRRIIYQDENGVQTPIYFTLKEGDFFKIPKGAGVGNDWNIQFSDYPIGNLDKLDIKIEYDYLYY